MDPIGPRVCVRLRPVFEEERVLAGWVRYLILMRRRTSSSSGSWRFIVCDQSSSSQEISRRKISRWTLDQQLSATQRLRFCPERVEFDANCEASIKANIEANIKAPAQRSDTAAPESLGRVSSPFVFKDTRKIAIMFIKCRGRDQFEAEQDLRPERGARLHR